MTGRPSSYSEEKANAILTRLAEGTPLTVICRDGKAEDPSFPCDDTVRNWMEGDADFAKAYARARATGMDAIAVRARQTLRGKTEENGGESTGDVQRDKAIADYDLKLLAKWDPKRYGDSTKVEMSGHLAVSQMTDEDLLAEIAAARAAGIIPAGD